MQRKLIVSLLILSLYACATRDVPAPIVNITHDRTYVNNSNSMNQNYTLNNQNSLNSNVANKTVESATNNNEKPVNNVNKEWVVPTNGTLVNTFSVNTKGVDYTGDLGQSINAINDGVVVYSGNGLKGYGNLIIIRHNQMYLSAYAHNQENIIHEGQKVKRGQKIATMGSYNNRPLLHLELRQNGRPVDPLSFLE